MSEVSHCRRSAAHLNWTRQGPTVTAASFSSGEVLTPGPLTFWATFSEPMREAELGPEDVVLHGVFADRYFAPVAFSYDTAEKKVTVEFPSLPEDMYRLTLLSGDGHFESQYGHDLDGDGDGWAGGDYVVEFSVDSDTWDPLPAVEPVWPHGSLIYRAGVSAAVSPAGDVDTYTIDLDAGQTVSLAVRPTSTLKPVVELTRLDGWVSVGNAEASEPGQPALLQTVEIETAGTYVISIWGGSFDFTVGGYTLGFGAERGHRSGKRRRRDERCAGRRPRTSTAAS
jgi:large repetitive protein